MTAEGAKRFVLAFYAERDRIIQHNEEFEKYLPDYLTPECECRLLFDFYRRTVLPGRLEGGLITSVSARTETFGSDEADVLVTYAGGEQRLLSTNGTVRQSSPPYETVDRVRAIWQNQRWYVADIAAAR